MTGNTLRGNIGTRVCLMTLATLFILMSFRGSGRRSHGRRQKPH